MLVLHFKNCLNPTLYLEAIGKNAQHFKIKIHHRKSVHNKKNEQNKNLRPHHNK